MTATTPPDYWQIARNLQNSLEAIGIKNVNVSHLDASDGVKDGLIFIRQGEQTPLSKDGLLAIIDQHRAQLTTVSATAGIYADGKTRLADATGKIAWLDGFKKFVIEERTEFILDRDYDVAVISEETAAKAPFTKLLENAKNFAGLQPVNWDLDPARMQGVVKALNNIAHMEGQDNVHFQLEKGTGKVTYFSDPPRPLEELHGQISSLLRTIVAQDRGLAPGGKLTDKGHNVAAMMDAFKKDRHYIAFEKETDYGTASLVDIVENAQIALTAKHYLNFKNVSVKNEEAFVNQDPTKRSNVTDGRDAYSYDNWNLTSVRKGHIGEFNQMAPIPNLTTADEIFRTVHLGGKEYKIPVPTNHKTDQGEKDLIKTLEELRAVLPVEFSPDPEPEAATRKPTPVHKAKPKQGRASDPVPKKEGMLI